MNVLIVYAHQEPKSFCGALLLFGLETLKEGGHEVKVSDLYAMKFNPVCDRNDFLEVADPDYFKVQKEQSHATSQRSFAQDIAQEQEKVEWADIVIFHQPLWWFSIPAITKGWFDRVLALGFAYGGGRWFDKGVFRGKKAMLTITAGAPESRYQEGHIFGGIDRVLYPLHVGLFNFVGFDILEPFITWAPVQLSAEGRETELRRYQSRLASLASEATLPFHSLEQHPDPMDGLNSYVAARPNP
jgi:NAD(P)H dehydrogenase (quinone)